MKLKACILPLGLLLSGCVEGAQTPVVQQPSLAEQTFTILSGMAGPNQNVQTARLRADDNCYWYQYAGPVETTELPLLTPEGRHICAPAPLDPAT